MSSVNLYIVLVSVLFASFGQVFFKLGATSMQYARFYINSWILFGFLFYLVGAGLWIYVLSREDLIKVFPFTALTFIITYFFGYFMLGEHVSKLDAFGLLLIILGLLIIVKN
jgi:drug/metabolite transporter (DMT)-like permease